MRLVCVEIKCWRIPNWEGEFSTQYLVFSTQYLVLSTQKKAVQTFVVPTTFAKSERMGHPAEEHIWQYRFYDFMVFTEKKVEKLRYATCVAIW